MSRTEKSRRLRAVSRGTALFFLAASMGLSVHTASPVAVFAATKPINTVSIKVTSKLEPGVKLPKIQIGGTPDTGGVSVSGSGSKYSVTEAEWVDKSGDELKAAEEPQMRVTLEPEDVSEDYFPASYKSSSVKISGGTFVSARRDGDNLIVTLRVKGVKDDFGQPEEAYWNENNLGEARWEKPDNASGYYEVQLYRDSKQVYRVAQTSSLQYNFYPYMTKAGEYTFKVRSIPVTAEQKQYGGNSDWTESGELTITDRYVSDGKGQQNENAAVRPGTTQPTGWVKEGDGWIYRLPDGQLCREEWYCVNDQWYYFDGTGHMQTGWRQEGANWYYLYSNGAMAVGWSKIGGVWYYFYPLTENGHTKGVMAGPGWQVIGPYYYYFNSDGSMYKGWLNQNGNWYYLNTVENSLEGAMFTGWLNRDGNTYFTDANGVMVQGWMQIDGNWYYFMPGSGVMARDTYINSFYLDSDGIWRQEGNRG